MTKKDYFTIADCIKNVIRCSNLNEKQADNLVVNFAEMLKRENNRFCAIKFGAYIAGIKGTMPILHEIDETPSHIHARGAKTV